MGIFYLEWCRRKIIYNCWEKSGLIVSESTKSTPIIYDEQINLMKIEGEDDCVEFITDSELLYIGFGLIHYE